MCVSKVQVITGNPRYSRLCYFMVLTICGPETANNEGKNIFLTYVISSLTLVLTIVFGELVAALFWPKLTVLKFAVSKFLKNVNPTNIEGNLYLISINNQVYTE